MSKNRVIAHTCLSDAIGLGRRYTESTVTILTQERNWQHSPQIHRTDLCPYTAAVPWRWLSVGTGSLEVLGIGYLYNGSTKPNECPYFIYSSLDWWELRASRYWQNRWLKYLEPYSPQLPWVDTTVKHCFQRFVIIFNVQTFICNVEGKRYSSMCFCHIGVGRNRAAGLQKKRNPMGAITRPTRKSLTRSRKPDKLMVEGAPYLSPFTIR